MIFSDASRKNGFIQVQSLNYVSSFIDPFELLTDKIARIDIFSSVFDAIKIYICFKMN